MKRLIYIAGFVFLGVLSSTLVHSVVEIWYIGLLVRDFETYGLGLSWQAWTLIHHIAALLLLVGGILCGIWQGNLWWPRLYDAEGKLKPRHLRSMCG